MYIEFMLLSIAVLLILFIPVVLYFLWIFDHLFGNDDFETSKGAIRKISGIITGRGKAGGMLYDLGSSRGSFVFRLSRICPHLKIVGIDNSFLRIWFSRLGNIFTGGDKIHSKFLMGDIFAADVSKADIIFVYLPRPLLPKLAEKLQRELKLGALVITYRVHFPNWRPEEIHQTDFWQTVSRNNIFVYSKK